MLPHEAQLAAQLAAVREEFEQQLEILKEQLRLALKREFGRSS